MTTLSRHDTNLLNIVKDFIEEIQTQFKGTGEYNDYKFYLDDSFAEVLRIVDILKDKQT